MDSDSKDIFLKVRQQMRDFDDIMLVLNSIFYMNEFSTNEISEYLIDSSNKIQSVLDDFEKIRPRYIGRK